MSASATRFIVIAIVVIAIIVYGVVRSRMVYFECPRCQTRFRLGPAQYVLAPHALGKRMATCPNCHLRDHMGRATGQPPQ